MVSLGAPFGDRRNEAEIDWARLDREYEIPRVVTRTDGYDNAWTIVRRAGTPGDDPAATPRLEVEIAVVQLSPPEQQTDTAASAAWLDTPTLTIGDCAVSFPARLTEGQRLICRDQAAWHVLNADGTTAASGRLPDPFPTLAPGANRTMLEFQRQVASNFRAVVKLVKVYP